MYCPTCKADRAISEGDPSVDRLKVDTSGTVRAEVQIQDLCDVCGDTLRAASLRLSEPRGDLKAHQGDGHHLNVEARAYARLKGHFGVHLDWAATCSCGRLRPEATGSFEASAPDASVNLS